MNPILPRQYYVPDVEARDWGDGRIYLYGSMDVEAHSFYCSRKYHVFSSDNMIDWVDHGQSFHNSRSHSQKGHLLFAPDCIRKDGRYCLLYCGNSHSEGVAFSDDPGGPFGKGSPVAGADGDAIDPCGLVDDDGAVYYYWGQFELRGARLKDDLSGIDEATFNGSLLSEKKDGFHEGACIRKRNGIYYMVYTDTSRGKATSLGYAMSNSPLGPYEKKGIIIDNTGCDPNTWNNHGSIEPFNGQWYVFYHRSSNNSNFSRRVCVEPIFFNDDGTIDEVEMTTQGPTGPIPATTRIEAFRACLLSGKLYCSPIPTTRPDEISVERLTWIHDGDWAVYKYLAFDGDLSRVTATIGSAVPDSVIEIRLDAPDGPVCATLNVPETGGWTVWQHVEARLTTKVIGTHAVYLVFRAGTRGRILDLLDFRFCQ